MPEITAPPGYQLVITEHVYWRAAERFPGFDTVLIEPEIRAAFSAGRVSRERPPGFRWEADPHSIYVWSEDGTRCYALRNDHAAFYVTTVMRRDYAPDALAALPPNLRRLQHGTAR